MTDDRVAEEDLDLDESSVLGSLLVTATFFGSSAISQPLRVDALALSSAAAKVVVVTPETLLALESILHCTVLTKELSSLRACSRQFTLVVRKLILPLHLSQHLQWFSLSLDVLDITSNSV